MRPSGILFFILKKPLSWSKYRSEEKNCSMAFDEITHGTGKEEILLSDEDALSASHPRASGRRSARQRKKNKHANRFTHPIEQLHVLQLHAAPVAVFAMSRRFAANCSKLVQSVRFLFRGVERRAQVEAYLQSRALRLLRASAYPVVLCVHLTGQWSRCSDRAAVRS